MITILMVNADGKNAAALTTDMTAGNRTNAETKGRSNGAALDRIGAPPLNHSSHASTRLRVLSRHQSPQPPAEAPVEAKSAWPRLVLPGYRDGTPVRTRREAE